MITIEQIIPTLTWRLRRDVMYPGKKLAEVEMAEDADGIHFGAFMDNKLAGVISLFQDGTEFQFRKLAVDKSLQRMGVGNSLLNWVTQYARENGGTLLWCNARVSATGFYLKAGYIGTGKLFTKNGVDYEIMEKMIIPVSTQ